MNREMLHAYLDGELGPQERASVENALAQDSALADTYAQLVALDAALEHAWDVPLESQGPSESQESVGSRGPVASQDARSVQAMIGEFAATERRARRGRVIAMASAAAGIAAALLLTFLPTVQPQSPEAGLFTDDEAAGYVYWESDGETYGTGDLSELEDQILDVLGAS